MHPAVHLPLRAGESEDDGVFGTVRIQVSVGWMRLEPALAPRAGMALSVRAESPEETMS